MGCAHLVDKIRWVINFFNIEGVRQYLKFIILKYYAMALSDRNLAGLARLQYRLEHRQG